MIDDDTEITVVEVVGKRVRLGISAKHHVAVHRREIWVQIPREGEAADKQQHPDRFRRSDGALLVPQTQAIVAAVCEEVDLAGGQIADCHDDGRRLFLRTTVPIAEEVRPGDIIQEGIAVAAGNAEVKIRHFVYRQVCRNGAVIPQSISGQSFSRVEGDTSSHLVTEILAGIRERGSAMPQQPGIRDCREPYSRDKSATSGTFAVVLSETLTSNVGPGPQDTH